MKVGRQTGTMAVLCNKFNWFNMSSSSSGRFSFDGSGGRYSASVVGSRLCFKSEELSDYAGETFIDIYREFFVIK